MLNLNSGLSALTLFGRLPKMVGLPKPFQIFSGLPASPSSQELGVPKPFQQNAAHFVVFFNAHQLT